MLDFELLRAFVAVVDCGGEPTARRCVHIHTVFLSPRALVVSCKEIERPGFSFGGGDYMNRPTD